MANTKGKISPIQIKRLEEKGEAINKLVALILSANSSDEEKVATLKMVRTKVMEDPDFNEFEESDKYRLAAIKRISGAIEIVEDTMEAMKIAEEYHKNYPVQEMPNKRTDNKLLIDRESVYNPTIQALTPMAMMKWQAMQIINMYCWFGMPCVVSIAYDSGISVRVFDITYEYIEYLRDDVEMDVVLFTDGKRATVVKES